MTIRTIAVNLDLKEKELEWIQNHAQDWNVIAGADLSAEELLQAEIMLNWKKGVRDILSESNRLRWVQTWSAGVNRLPLEQLKAKGIHLTSANGVHAYPISETIFAMLLGFTRRIDTYVRQQQLKKWEHANLRKEIHEKTIGILGIGAIGLETARIAKAFGMKVLGMRYSGRSAEYVDQMYKPKELDKLLPQCDYVVITLPLTEQTKDMFTTKEFKLMKENAFLVNIGRGPIIKEADLIQALEKNEIAGAGLDVFVEEPLAVDSPLWEMENVIITPHTAGSTEYYTERVIRDIFLPNFKAYLQTGKPTTNLVNYSRGY
ncbi:MULTISPECIES: D-2-hydroxyacid dehydrogenase [Gracilibacillus]|uniref:Hydroxyacid dehydrogenase n=1 Tax=Gracilibacillus dipsosauri TaxID=178340 RepID=A0A317L1N7_9BACI|nr:D-2-hydroxyacid dehydrogenase [Gracilibacillus dipsosauri]PWU69771.1 hydroxyacid dehydrogenase [Gracilibacillus dipsosauri]